MTREIELKLELDPDDLALARQDPLLAGARSRSNHQVTVYYDTPETRLKKHGYTLRVRSVGGKFIQTVKPVTESVGLVSREELECEVASMEPDLGRLLQHPLSSLLRKGAAERLEPIILCDVSRTSWLVEQRHQRIEIDLDHGTITAGEHSQEFAEIEFELRDGAPASLIIAARRLADHAPVRLGVLTKAERGFLLADNLLRKVTKAASVHIHPGIDVAEAFEIIVHACLKHYRLNEPLVIHDRDAGALHQSRVAMRRLRSAFTLFRPAVEDVEFQHLRQELRWFSSQLGDARNVDVYLERDIDEQERAELIRKRELAYDEVIDAMNSHKFRRLLIDLVGWIAIGSWRGGKPASRPVDSFANRRLDRLWKSVAGVGRNISRLDEDSRHELRIEGKKLRYAIEFLRGLYPASKEEEKKFAHAIGNLQDALGKLNDIQTARTLFETAPAKEPWLIGSLDERRQLIAAQDAMRELLRTGPFWRRNEQLEHA